MNACPICGASSPVVGRFCPECGAHLSRPLETREARKVVTVLFSDVTGFTPLSERLDPEALHLVMVQYYAAMREIIERHGGRLEHQIGDAVLAVFGLPTTHEDDAWRALRAATEIGDALNAVNARLPAGLGVQLTASTGVTTGEVFASQALLERRSGSELLGDCVNVAARLEAEAGPGEVLLGEQTFRVNHGRITAERVELTIKGKSETVVAYRLKELLHTGANDRRLSARTVGREREAAAITAAFGEACSRRSCVLLTLIGAAGSGKSRLVQDASVALGYRARVLSGRCLPYGEATVYWALAEITRQAAGIAADVHGDEAELAIAQLLSREPTETDRMTAARLAGALGLRPLAGAPEEIPADIATLMSALANRGPVIVVIEDLHWATDGLLAALEQLRARISGAPVLVLCTARPDLRERRPSWAWDTAIELAPLDDKDCALLTAELLGHEETPRLLADRVGAVAAGNPLIVEEILAMLIDDGALAMSAEGWRLVDDTAEIRIPPRIEAILAARLDRLEPDERTLLEGAAIMGKEFDLRGVESLCELDPRAADVAAQGLCRRQFIHPATGTLADYRFHHMLLRDAAYATTPKRRRALLHLRFASQLKHSSAGAGSGLYGEIVGEHLERACSLRRELGADDRQVGELAHRAARLLRFAGRRAMGLSDFQAARRIFARGATVLARDDPLRADLLIGLAEATLETGLWHQAVSTAEEAVHEARRAAAEEARIRASLVRARSQVHCGMRPVDDGLADARKLATDLERAGDGRAIALGWMAVLDIAGLGARFSEAWTAAARAVEIARRASPDVLPYCLIGMCSTVSRAPLPLRDGLRRCREAHSLAQPDTLHAAIIDARGTGFLEGMAGQLDSAIKRFVHATELCERYNARSFQRVCRLDWGLCELQAGKLEHAEQQFAHARELSASLDELIRGEAAALHAWAQARLGRHSEALQEALAAGKHMSLTNLEFQVYWRIAAATALKGMSDLESAETRAREAVSLARPTEGPHMLGAGLQILAEILTADGREHEADESLRESIAIYEALETTPALGVSRELLVSV